MYIYSNNSLKEYFHPISKTALIFWKCEHFCKIKRSNMFFKFAEPCKHRAYRSGDSWSEELDICRKTFNVHFEEFGIRYKSKTAYLESEDKFKGKLYASYFDRDLKKVFYIRNDEKVNELLKYEKLSKNKSPNSGKNLTSIPTQNGKKSNSFGGTIGGNINIPSLHEKTTLTTEASNETEKNDVGLKEEVQLVEDMKEIWLKEVGEFGVSHLSSSFGKRLLIAFRTFFSGCLEKWRGYCRAIASSKFLMGETGARTFKKIWITWAIKVETYTRIMAGEFGLGTRLVPVQASIHLTDLLESAKEEHKPRELEQIKGSDEPEIMKKLRACFIENYGMATYQSWFSRISLRSFNGKHCVFEVPNAFTRDYMINHYLSDLRECLKHLYNKEIYVEFEVKQK